MRARASGCSTLRDAHRLCGGELRSEFLEVRVHRGDLARARAIRVGRARRRPITGEAAGEETRRVLGIERSGVDEKIVRRSRDLAPGSHANDDDPVEHDVAQRPFAAGTQDAIAVADRDEAGRGMFALQLRDAQPDFEFARALARGIGGRPLGGADDSDGGRFSPRRCEHQRRARDAAKKRGNHNRRRAADVPAVTDAPIMKKIPRSGSTRATGA
ncbi:MAG TPA: hypothetical protein VHD62_15295 [Opitutaceae bacterium]|nr:hypothetical protein [Opitutaceae bacterium]